MEDPVFTVLSVSAVSPHLHPMPPSLSNAQCRYDDDSELVCSLQTRKVIFQDENSFSMKSFLNIFILKYLIQYDFIHLSSTNH